MSLQTIEDFSQEEINIGGPRRWGIAGLIDYFYSVNPTEEDMKTMPEEFREVVEPSRNFIRASELGKNYWERYQSARGVPSTNPFDARVMQVFEHGRSIEASMKHVLRQAGVFRDTQDEQGVSLLPATETTVEVRGHYDGFVGGQLATEEEVIAYCKKRELSKWEIRRAILVNRECRRRGEMMEQYIFEAKSINSRVFWKADRKLDAPYHHHKLQTYFYLKRKVNELASLGVEGCREARIVYQSKDDGVKAEFPIMYPNQEIEDEIEKDIKEMSYFLINNIEPPKPEEIVFREEKNLKFIRGGKEVKIKGVWETNWEVARSTYFTLLTGKSSVKEWEESLRVEVASRNNKIKADYDNKMKGTV